MLLCIQVNNLFAGVRSSTLPNATRQRRCPATAKRPILGEAGRSWAWIPAGSSGKGGSGGRIARDREIDPQSGNNVHLQFADRRVRTFRKPGLIWPDLSQSVPGIPPEQPAAASVAADGSAWVTAHDLDFCVWDSTRFELYRISVGDVVE